MCLCVFPRGIFYCVSLVCKAINVPINLYEQYSHLSCYWGLIVDTVEYTLCSVDEDQMSEAETLGVGGSYWRVDGSHCLVVCASCCKANTVLFSCRDYT